MTDLDAEKAVITLLQWIGEDPTREGLADTPRRVARAFDFFASGYRQTPEKILSTAFSSDGYDEMIVCRSIEFYSMCEHHLLPFSGVAHVAYIPKRRVVGLSKMARLVECFARRLQLQERMTKQIADTMQRVLKPLGAGVVVQARHLCMACRGVQKQRAEMVTCALTGVFHKPEVRAEFLSHTKA